MGRELSTVLMHLMQDGVLGWQVLSKGRVTRSTDKRKYATMDDARTCALELLGATPRFLDISPLEMLTYIHSELETLQVLAHRTRQTGMYAVPNCPVYYHACAASSVILPDFLWSHPLCSVAKLKIERGEQLCRPIPHEDSVLLMQRSFPGESPRDDLALLTARIASAAALRGSQYAVSARRLTGLAHAQPAVAPQALYFCFLLSTLSQVLHTIVQGKMAAKRVLSMYKNVSGAMLMR